MKVHSLGRPDVKLRHTKGKIGKNEVYALLSAHTDTRPQRGGKGEIFGQFPDVRPLESCQHIQMIYIYELLAQAYTDDRRMPQKFKEQHTKLMVVSPDIIQNTSSNMSKLADKANVLIVEEIRFGGLSSQQRPTQSPPNSSSLLPARIV